MEDEQSYTLSIDEDKCISIRKKGDEILERFDNPDITSIINTVVDVTQSLVNEGTSSSKHENILENSLKELLSEGKELSLIHI